MLLSLFTLAACAVASPAAYDRKPFAKASAKRQATYSGSSLEVDLGYSVYQGFSNASAGLDVFKGWVTQLRNP